MGNVFAYCNPVNYERQRRVLMLGIESVGKTTIFYKLRLGKRVKIIPTVAFNQETIEFNGTKLDVWDLGGNDRTIPFWHCYFQNTDAIIFVVDSGDRDKIVESSEEFYKLLNHDDLKDIPFLILANKQDLPNIMSTDEISAKLNLESINDREWYIQGTSAITSEGINRGLEWLISVL